MTRFIRTVFFSCIGLILLLPCIAQEGSRGFNQSQLEELRSDSDYQYELLKPEPEDFLSRLWNQLVDWFWGLFGSDQTADEVDIIIKLLLATAFVYFIIKIFGADPTSLFKPNKKKVDLAYDVDEEAIHEINFEQEVELAKKAKNFRLLIRLYYLWVLKQAADADWVQLMQGKTNYEYLHDLKGKPIEQEFKKLSYLFDYTWYGHFDADEGLAERAKSLVDQVAEKKGGRQ
jgi:hypothetical protein